MSLEGDCHEVEVTPNLESLITFGMSGEGGNFVHNFTTNSYLIRRDIVVTKNVLLKTFSILGMQML